MFAFNYYNPVRTEFGLGTFKTLGEKAAQLGKKALLVNYENHIVLENVLNEAKELLNAQSVEAVEFYQFRENPSIETVAVGVELAKKENCDMIIAIGGGSVMDGAKAIAAGVFYDGNDLWDMVFHRHDGSGSEINPPEKALPIIAVPTVPATGSEMNMCSVVTNETKKEKSYIWAECLFPQFAILDPELSYTLPASVSACSAADAISHALEIYINSVDGTPLQNYWQEGTMRTIIENIPAAIANPTDPEARGNLTWAAACAINGWANPGDGWTPMHQVGHVLSSRFGVNHGTSLTVIMPHWMRYNSERRPSVYERFALRVMNVEEGNKTSKEIINEGIDKFEAFLKNIGVATILSEINITENDLDNIVNDVEKVSFNADGVLGCNPVMTKADILNVLKMAL
ncbi:iron-containing alcohol dehydrogenase [Lentisphaerota bacterium WC36G]|nr:iron-containing alcohol dehydrogenase [Lentisphaerae bacterium WC36]